MVSTDLRDRRPTLPQAGAKSCGGHADSLAGDIAVPEEGCTSVRYDFRRTERFTKDQLRGLELLYEQFARQLGGTLSAYLRTTASVTPVGLEQLTYGEFIRSRAETTALWSLALEPAGGTAALELNPDAAYAMAYTMMGGRGESTTEARALTEIELALCGRIVNYILQTLGEVWKSQGDLRFSVLGCDTRPQMLSIASGTDPFILGKFEVAVGEEKGTLTLGIPTATIQSGGIRSTRTEPRPVQDPADARRLQKQLERVPLPVTAQFESLIPASDVAALRVGDVVSISSPVTTEVDVHVSDKRKFYGKLFAAKPGVRVRIERAAE